MFKNKVGNKFLMCILFIIIINFINLDSKNKCKKYTCFVGFEGNFDDSITVYVNGKFKSKDYYVTNEILGICLTEKTVLNIINKPDAAGVFLKLCEGDEIKIESITDKSFIKFKYKFYKDRRSLSITKRGTKLGYEFHGVREYK